MAHKGHDKATDRPRSLQSTPNVLPAVPKGDDIALLAGGTICLANPTAAISRETNAELAGFSKEV
jgi:hypothetical protein